MPKVREKADETLAELEREFADFSRALMKGTAEAHDLERFERLLGDVRADFDRMATFAERMTIALQRALELAEQANNDREAAYKAGREEALGQAVSAILKGKKPAEITAALQRALAVS